MSNLVVSLLGGVLIIATLFILLYSLSRMSGKMVSLVMAFVVTGVYVPLAVFTWPGADVFAIHIALYLVSVYVLGIVASSRDQRISEGKRGFVFHWAPAAIVIFFIILIILDSFFVMFATKGMTSDQARMLLPAPEMGGKVSSHFPGVVSHDFHEKYDQYNDYVNRFKLQQLRHWDVRKGWLTKPVVNTPSIFRVEVFTKDKKVVTGAKVLAMFLRPANSKEDKHYTLLEIEPGVYQQSINLPEPGHWDLVLDIKKGKDEHEVRAKTVIADKK